MRILKRTIALALAASLVIPASSSFAVYGAEENNNQINVTTPNQDDLTIGYSGQSSYQALAAGNWQSTIEKPTSKVSKPDDKNILYSEIVMAVNTSPNVKDVVSAPMPQNSSAQNNLLGEGQDSYVPPEGFHVIGYNEGGYILEPEQDYSVPDSDGVRSRTASKYVIGDKITLENGKVEVTMKYEGKYCTVWGEDSDEKFTDEIAAQIAKEYDDKIYLTLTDYFLDESAYDETYFALKGFGDGDGKLAIACHKFSQNQGNLDNGFLAGYFNSADLQGKGTVKKPIDMVHVSTYPGMAFNINHKYDPRNAYGTFAHELQHLLNYYAYLDYFYAHNGAEGCPTWLNEGMSEASSTLCGYTSVSDRVKQYNLFPQIRSGLSFMDWKSTLENYALSAFFAEYMMAQSSSGARVFQSAYKSDLWSGEDGVTNFFKNEYGLKFDEIIKNYRTGLASKNTLGGKYNLGSKVTGLEYLPFSGASTTLKGGGAVHNTQYTKATQVEPSDNLEYVGISEGAEYTISAKVSDGTNESTAQEIKAPAGSKVVLTPDLTAGQKVTSYTTSFDSDVNKPTQQANQISFVMPPNNVTVTANVGEATGHTVTYNLEHLTAKTSNDQDAPNNVENATNLNLVLTADEGYKCPSSRITVRMKDANGDMVELKEGEYLPEPEPSYYRYEYNPDNPYKTPLTIYNITGDIEITASGTDLNDVFPFTLNLEHVETDESVIPPTVTPEYILVIPLWPEEGYALPHSVEVIMGDRVLDESEYAYDRNSYRLRIANITGPLEVNVVGIPAPTFNVNYNLTNLTKSGPDEFQEESILEFKLIPDEGYKLPELIRIMANDIELDEGAGTYTYDRASGEVHVLNVHSDVHVYAEGVPLDEEPTSRHQVTYNLERLGYTGPSSVAHGETLIVGLIPERYSAMPETVEVTMGGSPAEFEYIRGQGSIKVENVIDDVVIYAVGIDITPPESGYAIQYELTNMYKNGAPSIVGEGEPLSATLYARSGYILPDEITVSMGGVVLTEGEYTYTHDRSWGTVVIPSVIGDVLIQGSAIRYSYPTPTPNPNPDNSGTGGGIIINGDTSGSSGSSSSSDSGSSSSSKPYTEKESTFKSISELGLGTIKDKASSNVDSKGAVKSSNVVNAVSASNKDVTVKNGKTVTNSILKKMAAKNPDARLVAETTKNGKTVAKLILNAKDSKDYKANLSLGVEVNNKALKSRLVKAFSNNVQAVTLSQGGNFGAEVEVIAKITTTSMDKNNLKFYTYDRDKNTYKEIEVGSYRFDSDGMLHFTTSVGGDILISSGEIKKK